MKPALVKEYNLCCDMQDLINNNGMNVCRSCGVVHGYNFANKYIDFCENKGKTVRKSIYDRKYNLYNIINNICRKYNFQISNNKI